MAGNAALSAQTGVIMDAIPQEHHKFQRYVVLTAVLWIVLVGLGYLIERLWVPMDWELGQVLAEMREIRE